MGRDQSLEQKRTLKLCFECGEFTRTPRSELGNQPSAA